jgi:hypothetical protein
MSTSRKFVADKVDFVILRLGHTWKYFGKSPDFVKYHMPTFEDGLPPTRLLAMRDLLHGRPEWKTWHITDEDSFTRMNRVLTEHGVPYTPPDLTKKSDDSPYDGSLVFDGCDIDSETGDLYAVPLTQSNIHHILTTIGVNSGAEVGRTYYVGSDNTCVMFIDFYEGWII